MRIDIACGGTGGHLFPGLAVAQKLRQRGHTVLLWLDERAVDYARSSGWDGEIEAVKATGFSGGVSLKSVAACFRLMTAVVTCLYRMRRNRPDVVLAMGSYASFGPVIAAKLCRVPVVLHEANAVPGRTISLLSRFADVVALTFAECASYFNCRTELTGFPVREDIVPYWPEDTSLKRGVFTLLIMGGSQGAHFLNKVCSDAVCVLTEKGLPVQVIHLAGKADVESVKAKYAATGVNNMVFSFLDDMGMAYGMADLAVCRAGASTCMELAAFELSALLVPLPSARRDHQTANAKVFVDAGASDMVSQGELSVNKLVEYIEMQILTSSLLTDKKLLLKKLAMPDAVDRIAELVESIAKLK
jgi:UDP-N-acetylglucosamine--N-acetylmuramyl-(pentapeptide) pyrophosphoryl-undecaprenol N-acetylglucosamine transferase